MPFPPHIRDGLVLAALAAILIGCAITNFRESLWIDELHTAWTVGDSAADVLPRAAEGNQGPLYFWIVWAWTKCFGLNEITLRLPSLLAAAALPVAVYGFLQRFDPQSKDGGWIPLLAAGLAATDMYAVYYAQEARPYAWVMLGAVLHLGTLLAWLEQPTGTRWWLLVVGAVALFHLHYTTALLFAAEGAVLLYVKLTTGAAWTFHLRDVLLVPLVVAAISAPSLPHIQLIAERRRNWEAFVKLHGSDFWWTFPATFAIFVIIAGAILRRFLQAKSAPTEPRRTPRLSVILALWLFTPLVIAFVCTYMRWAPIFYYRYLVAALPASWMLAAIAARALPGKFAPAIAGLVILGLWLQHQGPLRSYLDHGTVLTPRNEDWRAAVAHLNKLLKEAETDDPVIVDPDFIEEKHVSDTSFTPGLRSMLLCPVNSLYKLDVADDRLYTVASLHDPKLSVEAIERLNRCEHAWWICRNLGPYFTHLRGQGRVMYFYSEGLPGEAFGSVWAGRMKQVERQSKD